MKTRAEIYSKEAADMLRNITTYHYMRHDQLLRLYPGKEEKIDNLLSFFLRQDGSFGTNIPTYITTAPEAHADNEMLAALWGAGGFYRPGGLPLFYGLPGKADFYCRRRAVRGHLCRNRRRGSDRACCRQQPDDAEKRIVIVESAEQIGKLNIPDVTAYCTVDMNTGAVQYYKQE